MSGFKGPSLISMPQVWYKVDLANPAAAFANMIGQQELVCWGLA